MKVLYVGGTGEISYACVQRSVEAGREVAVFNRGRSDEPLPEGVEQITGDMNDDAAYARLGRRNWDAACQFLAYEMKTVQRDLEVFGGRCGQYVFISSTSAYRKPPTEYVITEDVPLVNPYWAYSRAKAEMEAWLLARHAAGKLPVTVVRPAHTYRRKFPGGIGPGDDWAWRVTQHKPVIVHGDGTSLWTLTNGYDFARPFVRLLGNAKALGQAFHITRHLQGYTWNEIFASVAQALGEQAELVHVPTDTLVRYNPLWTGQLMGDKVWPTLFDNSKVMSVAGRFECTVSLAKGFAQAAVGYRSRLARGLYKPDAKLHALLDRIARQQSGLGSR